MTSLPPPPTEPISRRDAWLTPSVQAVALFIVTFIAYIPALSGRFIWDDQAFSHNPQLRSSSGLYEIWFAPGSSPYETHYWPVVYTVFWIYQRLFGIEPFGIHLINVLLHCTNTVLIFRLATRLNIRAAIWGAALFGLHPVHVESVAWVIELKDVLSGLFYLLALSAWLTFDTGRGRRWLLLSLAMFALGLLSKSIVITLPASILILTWWKRGAVSRRVWMSMVSFAFVALICLTLDFYAMSKDPAPPFLLTPYARALVAGRAFWFYLSKVFWPHPLILIHPAWEINVAAAVQYAFPATLLLLLGGTIVFRRELGRGTVAAVWLYFITLSPILGFVTFNYMKHSYVADRYQYLASAAPILWFIAGIAGVKRTRAWAKALAIAICLVFAVLTWLYARTYYNVITSFEHVLKYNPKSWTARYGLADGYLTRKPPDPARAAFHLQKAIDIQPHGELFLKLAHSQILQGKMEEAIRTYRLALRLDSSNFQIRYSLAKAYSQMERHEDARRELITILKAQPSNEAARKLMDELPAVSNDPDNPYRPAPTSNPLS